MNWDELLKTVKRGGPCKLDTLAGTLTAEHVKELLAAAPSDPNGKKVLTKADFSGLTFVGSVSFRNVKFDGAASFDSATFMGDADFASINSSNCSFKRATFNSKLYVGSWKSSERLDFENSTFVDLARFYNIEADQMSFSGSTFMKATVFNDVKVCVFFNFVAVTFSERVRDFVAGCRNLNLQKSQLERGGIFYLHGGEVDISSAELGASTMIAGTRQSGQFHNQEKSLIVDGGDWRPRLMTLEGTDVEKLVLQDVNLVECQFRRSINLEKLRLEELCLFEKPPGGLHVGADPPFLWFWTPRLSIFEERIWRSHSRKAHNWRTPSQRRDPKGSLIVSARGDLYSETVPEKRGRQAQAEQLVKIYRALRKGREEAKNHPGAGDFYYGEMEMRRASAARLGERLVLWLYWIVSGYGLRPLRTLLALVIVVGISSYLLIQHGLTNPCTYSEAFLASLAATANLEYLKSEAFTLAGQWIRIVLKVLGPTLFGVFLLALWGHVKR